MISRFEIFVSLFCLGGEVCVKHSGGLSLILALCSEISPSSTLNDDVNEVGKVRKQNYAMEDKQQVQRLTHKVKWKQRWRDR